MDKIKALLNNINSKLEQTIKQQSFLADSPMQSSEYLDQKTIDLDILRLGIIAELDAISLYEQMSNKTNNEKLKKVLLDIAKEEKTHVSEFETLLWSYDKEQKNEIAKGKEEVDNL